MAQVIVDENTKIAKAKHDDKIDYSAICHILDVDSQSPFFDHDNPDYIVFPNVEQEDLDAAIEKYLESYHSDEPTVITEEALEFEKQNVLSQLNMYILAKAILGDEFSKEIIKKVIGEYEELEKHPNVLKK